MLLGNLAACNSALMRRREMLYSTMSLTGGLALASRGRASGAGIFGVQMGTPQDLATPIEIFDRLITPTEQFFVRSHFGAPALERKRILTIKGAKQSLNFGASDLKRFKSQTLTAVLQCAGNGRGLQQPHVPGLQWQHGAMGQATWTGVRLVDLLEAAGLSPDAAHVHLQGADRPMAPTVPGFLRSLPLARAVDQTTLVATHMNGQPLTAAHGAPFRLVVPGWSGQSWIKWLQTITPAPQEAEGLFQRTAYRMPKTPVKPGTAMKPEDTIAAALMPVRSVIAKPATNGTVKKGPVDVIGVAFSGDAAIATVDVSVDGGAHWTPAKLEGPAAAGAWQIFRHRHLAAAGEKLVIVARATDKKGQIQPRETVWNPSGYFWNGWHTINVAVAS